MKPKYHCFHLIPVLAAGLIAAPWCAQAQDRPHDGPPPAEAQRDAPNPERIQAMTRQIAELHQAGKHEEAQAIAMRLREAVKNHPEIAKQMAERMRQLRDGANNDARPDAPRPDARPDAPRPDAPQRPMMRQDQPQAQAPPQPHPQAPQPMAQPGQPPAPNQQMAQRAPQPPQPQVIRPNAPQARQQPQPQQPQVIRPNVERAKRSMAGPAAPQGQNPGMQWPNPIQLRERLMARPFMGRSQGPAMGWQQMMQPNPGQCRCRQMTQPNRGQGPGPMQQPGMAQGRGLGMQLAKRMQFRQHLMMQPYAPAGRNRAMHFPRQFQFRSQPTMQPQRQQGRLGAMPKPMMPQAGQCPQMGPNAAARPPVVRPKVEAAKQRGPAPAQAGEVAKIRHLKQAAEHMAAAGFAEHAETARKEISRMEAALKAAPAAKSKPMEPRAPKMPREKAQPKPGVAKPDANAAILGELKKLGKQMGDLSARVQKLEKR